MSKLHWADQFEALSNQSNFHEKVREIFATDPYFKRMKCYQEVPVADLINQYPNEKHRFDFYIENLNLVIELHGIQHYKPTSFGNSSYEKIQKRYKTQVSADHLKQSAALDNGFNYLEIPYKALSKLTAETLKNLILGSI